MSGTIEDVLDRASSFFFWLLTKLGFSMSDHLLCVFCKRPFVSIIDNGDKDDREYWAYCGACQAKGPVASTLEGAKFLFSVPNYADLPYRSVNEAMLVELCSKLLSPDMSLKLCGKSVKQEYIDAAIEIATTRMIWRDKEPIHHEDPVSENSPLAVSSEMTEAVEVIVEEVLEEPILPIVEEAKEAPPTSVEELLPLVIPVTQVLSDYNNVPPPEPSLYSKVGSVLPKGNPEVAKKLFGKEKESKPRVTNNSYVSSSQKQYDV